MIYKCMDTLPEDETPVLVLHRDEWKIGVLFTWETGREETYRIFRYWDDPNDSQDYKWFDVTHWTELPPNPPKLTKEEYKEWHTSYTKGQVKSMGILSL